jgi:MFS transporter, DHA1 family, multidrug/chloramphenicol efflux transport protein
MPFTTKITTLNRSTLLFPLALVLFEFAVYIGNDMAQPAMLLVTQEFGVGISWVPLSMTAYLIGGASLSWLTGPLSDRVGRRPVLLGGVAFFILCCLATYFVHDIETFIGLRVLQGIGLCFIGSVGYATVQETFDEVNAVKVTALMANVALIAPMIGPLAGAALTGVAPWRSCFLFISAISLISLTGLWKKMPETVSPHSEKPPYSQIFHDYLSLFRERRFVLSALSMALISLPLIGWIAMSPVLLVEDFGLSLLEYGLWQLPIFGSLVVGNLVVFFIADRWPLGRSVLISFWPMLAGMGCLLTGTLIHAQSPFCLVTGISLIAFAEGLSIAVLYRFALMSSEHDKGIVSSGTSILAMTFYALGIEITRLAYIAAAEPGFCLAIIGLTCCFIAISQPRIRDEMRLRALSPG